MTIVYIALAITIVFCLLLVHAQLQVAKARRLGIYPQKGSATMEDVKSLISSGHTLLAMRAYREIHGVSLKAAKREIERLKQA
jgi:ribosomal protein L7/L12